MLSPAGPNQPTGNRRFELATGVLAFGLTAVLFWPVSHWVIAQTLLRSQLQNALIVLVAATALALWRHGRRLPLQLRWSGIAIALLVVAYGCGGLALATHAAGFMFLGGVLALAAGGLFLFGRDAWVPVVWTAIAVAAFIGVVIAFPLLDWPLRQMSGVYSAQLLNVLGLAPRLAVVGDGDVTRLLLQVGERTFEVATECNGFGNIAATTLLALMLGLPAREPWWWKVILVPAAAAVGLIFNLLRILVICLLAPVFPHHYNILHETAGVIALWSALLTVWWLSTPRERVTQDPA